MPQVRRLHAFLAKRDAREARVKQQRLPKRKDASIQCDTGKALKKPQTSDAAVQTDSVDIMEELKQQVQSLAQIVAQLTAIKDQRHEDVRRSPGPLLSELLTDLPDMCQDSYEDSGNALIESPLPGLSAPSPVASAINLPSRPPLRTIQLNSPPANLCTFGPTDEQRRKVEAITFMGSQVSTTALACVNILFSEDELVNGNTAGTFGYKKLDEHKLAFLESVLRRKFDSPSFAAQWENIRVKINSKCRGKRRTVVKRLKVQAS